MTDVKRKREESRIGVTRSRCLSNLTDLWKSTQWLVVGGPGDGSSPTCIEGYIDRETKVNNSELFTYKTCNI